MGIEGDNLMQVRGIIIPAGNSGLYTFSAITFMLMALVKLVDVLGKHNKIQYLLIVFITLFGN